jgi:hypothetical protein
MNKKYLIIISLIFLISILVLSIFNYLNGLGGRNEKYFFTLHSVKPKTTLFKTSTDGKDTILEEFAQLGYVYQIAKDEFILISIADDAKAIQEEKLAIDYLYANNMNTQMYQSACGNKKLNIVDDKSINLNLGLSLNFEKSKILSFNSKSRELRLISTLCIADKFEDKEIKVNDLLALDINIDTGNINNLTKIDSRVLGFNIEIEQNCTGEYRINTTRFINENESKNRTFSYRLDCKSNEVLSTTEVSEASDIFDHKLNEIELERSFIKPVIVLYQE